MWKDGEQDSLKFQRRENLLKCLDDLQLSVGIFPDYEQGLEAENRLVLCRTLMLKNQELKRAFRVHIGLE